MDDLTAAIMECLRTSHSVTFSYDEQVKRVRVAIDLDADCMTHHGHQELKREFSYALPSVVRELKEFSQGVALWDET